MNPIESETLVTLAMLAAAPFALVLITSFAKIAVVLALLRSALGIPQVPSNHVITALAAALSLLVMAPVARAMVAEIEPWTAQMAERAEPPGLADYFALAEHSSEPLRSFLLKHGDPVERQRLFEIAGELGGEARNPERKAEDFEIAIPAFVLTELAEAFTIGFLLFLPFIVLDLVVANVLLSLGMVGLSPTNVSLPFKLLLFVLADGWYLVVHGLLLGYA